MTRMKYVPATMLAAAAALCLLSACGESDAERKARPLIDKWTFSTNGVTIMGRNGIPCIGFGPGAEAQAHAPNEITWKEDLVKCAAVYAALPTIYCENTK